MSRRAAEIQVEHEACLTAAQSAVEHAYRCGVLLMEAKAALKHGEYGAWIEATCSFELRTAQVYGQIARGFPNAQEAARFITITGALSRIAEEAASRRPPPKAAQSKPPSKPGPPKPTASAAEQETNEASAEETEEATHERLVEYFELLAESLYEPIEIMQRIEETGYPLSPETYNRAVDCYVELGRRLWTHGTLHDLDVSRIASREPGPKTRSKSSSARLRELGAQRGPDGKGKPRKMQDIFDFSYRLNQFTMMFEGVNVEGFDLDDEFSLMPDEYERVFDDLVEHAWWAERTLMSLQARVNEPKVREKIRNLRNTHGRTPEFRS